MATKKWTGGSKAIPQIVTIQITASAAAGTISATINGKTYTYTATGTDVNFTAAAFAAMLIGVTEPEFTEIIWTVATDTVTATGPLTGQPFVLTTAVSGGITRTQTTTQTAASPNHINVASNYSPSGVPVAGDVLWFTGESNVDALYELDALAAVDVDVNTSGYTGHVGLPDRNGNDQAGYAEYRAREFQTAGDTHNVGIGDLDGSGPRRFRFAAADAVPTVFTVYASGTPTDGDYAVTFRGVHAGNILNWLGGTVSVASDPLTSAVLNQIRGAAGDGSGAKLYIGPNVTGVSVDMSGGEFTTLSSFNTFIMEGGSVTFLGAAAVGVTSINGGTLNWMSSGSMGNVSIRDGATLDFSRDQRNHVTGIISMYSGSTMNDPNGTLSAATSLSWPDGIERTTTILGRNFLAQKQ